MPLPRTSKGEDGCHSRLERKHLQQFPEAAKVATRVSCQAGTSQERISHLMPLSRKVFKDREVKIKGAKAKGEY